MGHQERDRCDRGDASGGRWTRALADLPLTDRSAPQYGDLVNVDFPSEQEYKHHTSNWDTYQRRDFHPKVRPIELIQGTSRRLDFTNALVIQLGFVPIYLYFLRLVWEEIFRRAFDWVIDSIQTLIERSTGLDPSAARLATWVLIVAVALLWGMLILTLKRPDVVREKSRGPVEPWHLALIPSQSPAVFRWLRVSEFAYFWELFGLLIRSTLPGILIVWVLQALHSLQIVFAKIGLVGNRKAASYGKSPAWELNGIRTVWLGGDQVQFGCGPKGISIEHHGGYIYLIRWDKVALIYDHSPKKKRFSFSNFQAKHNENVECASHAEETDKDDDCYCCLSAGLAQADRLAKLARESEWAAESIRVRLIANSEGDFPDEIVIPKRFFGKVEILRKTMKHDPDEESSLKKLARRIVRRKPKQEWRELWVDFMEHCLTYKFYPEHAEGAGKSAGQIETGRPAHH